MTAEICVDAGGGRPRGGEFPRSMSDFKPGDPFDRTFYGEMAVFVLRVAHFALTRLNRSFGLTGFLREK